MLFFSISSFVVFLLYYLYFIESIFYFTALKQKNRDMMTPSMTHWTLQEYIHPVSMYMPIIIASRQLHLLPKPISPVLDQGIVFMVYSKNNCSNSIHYLDQAFNNTIYFKNRFHMFPIALVTNCPIPQSLLDIIDVVQIIDESDIPSFQERQWYTRVLYNAYPIFNYSLVIDTHVYPCDETALSELFDRFRRSLVDITIGSRVLGDYPNGAMSLFHASKNSHVFWKYTYKWMIEKHNFDDQSGIRKAVRTIVPRYGISFKKASSNWFFGGNNVNKLGLFVGGGMCFRSSLIVTGPIRFVHGSPRVCNQMNGVNREYVSKPRCLFQSIDCNTTYQGTTLAFSEEEYKRMATPWSVPDLEWVRRKYRPSDSLYW